MSDILEKMCVGSEDIKENKLSITCQKFRSFQMIKGETIDEMDFRFNKLLNEVQATSKDKLRDPNKTKISDEEAPPASKGEALKAISKDSKKQSKEKTELSSEDLLNQYAMMTEIFNKMESRLKKFKKIQKRNYKERKALCAKRDKHFEKKKAVVAEYAEDSSSSSSSSSSNSTSSNDESQALMAHDVESVPDNNLNSYDNRINRPKDKSRKQNKKKEEAQAPKNTWYLDSGCSKHMTGFKEYLSQYVEKAGSKVAFGDNSLGETKGYSILNMGNACISNVSYVSSLKYNLLSVSQFYDSGFSVKIKKVEFIVKNNKKKLVLKRVRQGNLYEVSWEDSRTETCLSVRTKPNSTGYGIRG
ncbi:protein SMY2-like [Salvia miltiorrhiza]|uniref:protein SMY2-like n=1 Tax=Salvia miltiorrhiza TaxID=226208 RepID=UPI0025AD1460|nr:protein SMY2-like [Salvia miltiorrhiza]